MLYGNRPAGRAGELILPGQHDGHDPDGSCSVGRIFRTGAVDVQIPFQVRLVVGDFPEDLFALDGDGADVVLAVGVVVLGKGIEGADSLDDAEHLVAGQGHDASGDVDAAPVAGDAELVIQLADT